MLHAHAPGERGSLVFLGFTPHDLRHLTARQPLKVDGKDIGMPGRLFVMLHESDPMIEAYLQFPTVVTIKIGQATIEAIKTSPEGFVQVAMNGPGFPPNLTAMFFFAPDDPALVKHLQATGLVKPTTPVIVVPTPPKSQQLQPQREQVRGPWFAAILCTAVALFLAFAPLFVRVKSVPEVLGMAALFGAGAAILIHALWKTPRGRTR